MKQEVSFAVVAVRRCLAGEKRPVATMYNWYLRGQRLRIMLAIVSSAIARVEARFWDAAALVNDVEEAGFKLGGMDEHDGGLEEATADLVELQMRAWDCLRQLEIEAGEAETALAGLAFLQARMSAQVPDDVYRLLSADIVTARFHVKDFRARVRGFGAGRKELSTQLWWLPVTLLRRQPRRLS